MDLRDWANAELCDGAFADVLADLRRFYGEGDALSITTIAMLRVCNPGARDYERWEIELVMRYCKSACEFDDARVQSDYSVIGSEFCDFRASLLTYRLAKRFTDAGLLKRWTYRRIMSLLRRAKKVRIGGGEWRLVRINPSKMEMLRALGLLPAEDKPPRRKPGRPKKQAAVIA